jgi:hypothetical protein
MMPSHHQNEHYAKAVVGQPIQVWGKASGGDYAGYTIDFGDGSAPATGDSVPKPDFINSLHSYTHSGTFVATLSVTNTDGKVFDRKVNIKVVATPSEQDKIDIAVEKGLLNLYGKASGLPGSCKFYGTQFSEHDETAATAAAVLAFEENGHLPTNDPVADIYQNLVNQGLLYLKGQPYGPEYYQTRSFVLSTLAAIQSMPRDPNAADFGRRWIGTEGQFIRNRIQKVTRAYNPNRSPYKGWTDDLSDQTDSTANYEASEWISYLLWKYDNVQNLFPSNFGPNLLSLWESYFNIEGYPVSLNNGLIFYDDQSKDLVAYDHHGFATTGDYWFSEWSLRDSRTTQNGWIGRIDNMFVLGKASHLIIYFPDDPFYQDWQQLMSGWLMGKNELTAYNFLTGSQGAVGPSYRVPGMLYGQNPNGTWSGPQMTSPNDVVSSPVATTALAVATLIREDVTPSDDQIHAEYGSNFVSVSVADNNPPIFGNDFNIGSDGMLTFSVSDADNDLIKIDFVLDGLQDGTTQVNGSGSVIYKGSNVKPLYGTNSVVVKIVDGWSENYRTWLIERPDKDAPYFNPQPVSVEIPTDRGVGTAGYYPPFLAYDREADGTEYQIGTKCSIIPGDKLGIGVHPVTLTATDRAGISVTAEYTVTVVDKELPTVSQPKDLLTFAANGGQVHLVVPDANDNSGQVSWEYRSGAELLWSSSGAGKSYQNPPLGTNHYVLMVTDGSGNSVARIFNAVVIDNLPPTLVKPNDIVVNNRPRNNGGDVYLPTPVVTDNSGSVSWAYTWGTNSYTSAGVGSPGNFFPIGTNQVSLTAFDPSGNTSSCTIKVTVVDNEAPVIGGTVAPFSKVTDPGSSYATVTPSIPSANDNSGTVTKRLFCNNVTYFFVGGTPTLRLPIGINVVNYTVIDPSGNMATTSFTVTVQDKEAPKFGSMPLVSVASGGAASVAVNYPALPVTDNDGRAPVLTYSKPSGSLFSRGMTPVMVTARDSSGNTASSSFTVYVY